MYRIAILLCNFHCLSIVCRPVTDTAVQEPCDLKVVDCPLEVLPLLVEPCQALVHLAVLPDVVLQKLVDLCVQSKVQTKANKKRPTTNRQTAVLVCAVW